MLNVSFSEEALAHIQNKGGSIVKQDDVEVLVSRAIAPFVSNVHLDLKKFLFMRSLKAKLQLQNGMVIAT